MPRRVKKPRSDHWTQMIRTTMEEPAWRALSPVAQALYPWLKLEWKGPNNNNNGKIKLSVRQASQRLGVGLNTAAKAFHELQAKGFIIQTLTPCLGYCGQARSASYELTEVANLADEKPDGKKLYKDWRTGCDFPVKKARANNQKGSNGRNKIPSSDL